MYKFSASRLRALINAGKLSAETIYKLRNLKMIPSKKQYMAGLHTMIEKRLQGIREMADARGIKQKIVSDGPTSTSHVNSSWPNDVFTRTSSPHLAEHEIKIPKGIKFYPGHVDSSSMTARDIITANHELDEYIGFYRNGGGLQHKYRVAPYIYSTLHQPGVLRNEKKLVTRFLRQMGIKNPEYGKFRLNNDRMSFRSQRPHELVEAQLTPRDYRDLKGIFKKMEDMDLDASVKRSKSYTESLAAANRQAKSLAIEKKNPRLLNLFKSVGNAKGFGGKGELPIENWHINESRIYGSLYPPRYSDAALWNWYIHGN